MSREVNNFAFLRFIVDKSLTGYYRRSGQKNRRGKGKNFSFAIICTFVVSFYFLVAPRLTGQPTLIFSFNLFVSFSSSAKMFSVE